MPTYLSGLKIEIIITIISKSNQALNLKTAFNIALALTINFIFATSPAWCETKQSEIVEELDINPEVIENSPVLQRWRNKIPNVLRDIRNEPSFRTRLQFGYSLFDGNSGMKVGFEDIFIVDKLTASGEYRTSFNNNFESYGTDLNYYLLPLGGYVNFAPIFGYRNLQAPDYSTSGVNLGVKLFLILSRGGAADIAFTRSWVSPGSAEEVILTKLSASYAITKNLRFSTELGEQKSSGNKERLVGFILEWMP